MMVDLRVKVMGLLDDPGLEAVKVILDLQTFSILLSSHFFLIS